MKSDGDTEQQGERLTLGQCRLALIGSLVWAVLLVALSDAMFVRHEKIEAALLGFFALTRLANAISSWRSYRLAREGAVVYAPPSRPSPLLPRVVSVPVVSALTLLVGASDVIGVVIAHSNFNNFRGWAITGLIVLPLSLYTVYCWHRIVGEKRRAEAETTREQPEGVWPPAPRTKTDEQEC